nr:ran-specific gtpase-activating protein 30 [Quercus suber]
MDVLLDKVTNQAMSYAIRSGIAITAHYAASQGSRLLRQTPGGQERDELTQIQGRLEGKIRIISPAIDMIELISARGHSTLESAVGLTKEIRYDIQKLGIRLGNAANEEELLQRQSSRAKSREENKVMIRAIIASMKLLLAKIEDAVPLINLAITASGVNLSNKLSGTISPSRLLQASTFLSAADSRYALDSASRQQVGPPYTLSLYMLFAGHASRPVSEGGIRETTWKEVLHKARVKLVRVPLNQLYNLPGDPPPISTLQNDSMRADAIAVEFAYQLVIVEDLDDDRFHSDEEGKLTAGLFDDVLKAGIRDIVPIHEVSKVFYADTGKILNIGADGDENSPVLLLKRDVHADPPRRMLHRSQMSKTDHGSYSQGENPKDYDKVDDQSEIDAQLHRESTPNTPEMGAKPDPTNSWRLPPDLDPEWIALEVFTDDSSDSDSDDEEQPSSRPANSRDDSPRTLLTGALSKLNLRSSAASSPVGNRQLMLSRQAPHLNLSPDRRTSATVKTSLSLLEMLIKLTALQQFRQDSHLTIEDELLNFFLEDSATAGAGSDKEHRQHLRHDAVKRVGFDPYDESPIRRRTEEYIHHPRGAASPRQKPIFDLSALESHFPYHDASEYDEETLQQAEFAAHFAPSSPSPAGVSSPFSPPPRRPLLQQTPSRTSTPGSFDDEKRRNAQPTTLVEPPSSSPATSSKCEPTTRRAQKEVKPRSPLGKRNP